MSSEGALAGTLKSSLEADPYKGDIKETGSRRRKLAGYLKAANELRQTYQQKTLDSWGTKDGSSDNSEGMSGAYPESVMVARAEDEEMVLFPSYAKRHTKEKPQALPGTIQQFPGQGRDARDTVGAGDAEFWQQQWERYEEDNAIVDVDVRGWIYAPHRGPLSRKNRIFIGLARQMVGLPTQPTLSRSSSRASSPPGMRDRTGETPSLLEEKIVTTAAAKLVRKGEAEADAASKGTYSEGLSNDAANGSFDGDDARSEYSAISRNGSLDDTPSRLRYSQSSLEYDDPSITPVQKRASWNAVGQMSSAEVAMSHKHLMTRLQPFLSTPVANLPVSAFFYNEKVSRQRTFHTDANGHFNFRASLDFVPTHVRVVANGKLSLNKEIIVTEPSGVSLISDIDDTVKHSAIGGGAREIFRNVFIRELDDLSIQGVREWYAKLAEMGVQFHYVSNSPWQLFPLLTSFFYKAQLPEGSIHLKAYQGMLQGIFEPVAERKKGTLQRIFQDFPDRRFILVGDSGEADLEVYTDVVLEYPGRVLAVFIRDVTTAPTQGFFDSAMGPLAGDRAPRKRNSKGPDAVKAYQRLKRWNAEEEDPELKAAIAASLKQLEEDTKIKENLEQYNIPEDRPNLPPRVHSEPPPDEEDLIDLNWDDAKPTKPEPGLLAPGLLRSSSAQGIRSPPVPSKPGKFAGHALDRSVSPQAGKQPPPRPRRPSSAVKIDTIKQPTNITPSTSSEPSTNANSDNKTSRPAPPQKSNTYRDIARQKLNSAYSHLPSRSTSVRSVNSTSSEKSQPPPPLNHDQKPLSQQAQHNAATANVTSNKPPPPPRRSNTTLDTSLQSTTTTSSTQNRPQLPPRKPLSSYPAAAASYASSFLPSASSITSTASNAANTAANAASSAAGTITDALTSSPQTTPAGNGTQPNSSSSYSLRKIDSSTSIASHASTSYFSTALGPSTSTTTTNNGNTTTQAAPYNKKEELWRRRWLRAKQIMDERGVMLRTWREGGDVLSDAVALVERAIKEKKEARRGGVSGKQ